jgi:hypothetical protein
MENKTQTKNRIPKGYAKNKLNLTLDNSELDFFEIAVKSEKSFNESMKQHILEKIADARRKQ